MSRSRSRTPIRHRPQDHSRSPHSKSRRSWSRSPPRMRVVTSSSQCSVTRFGTATVLLACYHSHCVHRNTGKVGRFGSPDGTRAKNGRRSYEDESPPRSRVSPPPRRDAPNAAVDSRARATVAVKREASFDSMDESYLAETGFLCHKRRML